MLRVEARLLVDPLMKGSFGDEGIGKKVPDDGESGFVLVNEGDAKLFILVEFVE